MPSRGKQAITAKAASSRPTRSSSIGRRLGGRNDVELLVLAEINDDPLAGLDVDDPFANLFDDTGTAVT
jgi:hypothetical protein